MPSIFLALVCISVKSAVSSIKSAAVNNDLMHKWELASGKEKEMLTLCKQQALTL